MVIKNIIKFIVFVNLFAMPVHAQPTSFKVKWVKVVSTGNWHQDPNGSQTADQCKLFQLSDKKALQWFRKSREVSMRVWLEELDWTQCSSTGTLTTADNRNYNWEIDQSGRGRIILSDTVSVYMSGLELPFRKNK